MERRVNVHVPIGPGPASSNACSSTTRPSCLSCETTQHHPTCSLWLHAYYYSTYLAEGDHRHHGTCNVVAVGRAAAAAAAAVARPYGDLPCAASHRRLPCEEDVIRVCDVCVSVLSEATPVLW